MLNKLLYLQSGDLKRLLPFFFLFFLIYSMLNIGEGISISLFVKRVGADKLPQYYGYTALFILTFCALYLFFVDKISNFKMFYVLLGGSLITYFAAWYVLQFMNGGPWCFGIFIINRELSFTLFLVHFGNFLLDYFTRAELNRVLPLIYSGGRIGGILGGIALGVLSPIFGVLNLVFIYFALGIACIILLSSIKKIKLVDDVIDKNAEPISMWKFLALLVVSGFLIWYGLNTFFFMISRTFINFQYNYFFETFFSSEVRMAQFLGIYTAITLAISLFIQIFVVNRVVALIGLKGGYFLYNMALLIGVILLLFPMSIFSAVYIRFIEAELRLGYRTSIINLIANKFPKPIRAKARAWGMGVIVPVSTLTASVILGIVNNEPLFYLIPIIGFIICCIYIFASFRLYKYFGEEPIIYKYLVERNLNFLAKFFKGKEIQET